MNKTQFLIQGNLYPTMTAQEEQQAAQQIVEKLQLAHGEPFTDDENEERGITALDILAMAKHLQNIAKLAADMLSNEALRQANNMIEGNYLDDKSNPIAANKQFEFHGNKWMLQIKENYTQLGYLRNGDGSLDPNSVTYRSLEAQQEQMRNETKALTAQMTGLKARLLSDHPKLQPTEIVVSLALKGQA